MGVESREKIDSVRTAKRGKRRGRNIERRKGKCCDITWRNKNIPKFYPKKLETGPGFFCNIQAPYLCEYRHRK